ncbi:helix-turn-helix domain-containing protein [Brevundimonas mediterranea]|uniref:helix-turn-helix domain-containing protein n=1 Tax=Brevundimonas mediterranea TaxID=74329 RepID=UPI004034889C
MPDVLTSQAQLRCSPLTASPNLNGKISLPVQEAAHAIGVSRSSLYERIKTGDLPSFKSCGRRLIRVAALLEMLDRDETASQRALANASNRALTAGSEAKKAMMSASRSAAGSA